MSKYVIRGSKSILFISFFTIFILISQFMSTSAEAQFQPGMRLEAGVLLKSPDITYDLSPLEDLEDEGKVTIFKVTWEDFINNFLNLFGYDEINVDNTEMPDGSVPEKSMMDYSSGPFWIPGTYYIYRSHYDSELGVVIYEFNPSDLFEGYPVFGEDGLGFSQLYIEGEEDAVNISDVSGLSVNIVIPSESVKKTLEIELATLNLDKSIELNDSLSTFMRGLGYRRAGESNASGTFGFDNLSSQQLMFSKGDVSISIASGNIGMEWNEYSDTMIWDWTRIGNSSVIWLQGVDSEINETVDQDVKAMLEFFDIDPEAWDSANREKYTNTYNVLEPSIDINPAELDWVSAMKTELEWLVAQSVVFDLTAEKIDTISNSIEAGSEIYYDDAFWEPGMFDIETEVGNHFEVYSFSQGLEEKFPVRKLTPKDQFIYTILVTTCVVVLIALSAFSYTRLKRRAILDNLNRKNIFDYIKANPGVHFKALLRELNFKPGAMSYHLNVLEKGEYIKSIQDGNYRRFYLFGTKSDLKIALTTIQLRILSIVDERPGISQVKISESIGKNRMLVNYHIKILADAGILTIEKSGRESHCFTTEATAEYLTG
ncbi:winged helix-turn-helix transcriptional regulator [[Eubacterium] cellulosolvens]